VNPSIFVQENLEDFFTVYHLSDVILGRGPYSEARVCTHKRTQAVRAVKIIFKRGMNESALKDSLLQEVQILRTLDHPNIVRIYENFEDSKNYYIVEEHCHGEDLFDLVSRLKQITEQVAARIMRQIFSAVGYLHTRQVVHRDLKPENIIVLNGNEEVPHVKLIDFDTATYCSVERQLRGSIGTAYYMAPEVLTKNYNEKCDMWSCGVLLYIMLSGTPPFPGYSDKEILRNVSKAQYTFEGPGWANISPEAISLISGLLIQNPADRLSANEAYHHPWITRNAGSEFDASQSVSMSIERIMSFHNTNKLKEAMTTFIISQVLAYEDLRELGEAFKAIDVNCDGFITKDELLRAFKDSMPLVEATIAVDRIFEEIDRDNSGYIDYTEFLRATIDTKLLISQKNLKNAFDMFDKDGNGLISTDELRQLFENGDSLDDSIWQDMLDEVDANKDGEIDIFKFEHMLNLRVETPRHSFILGTD
jgi:calcium-dependent protein kinase